MQIGGEQPGGLVVLMQMGGEQPGGFWKQFSKCLHVIHVRMQNK